MNRRVWFAATGADGGSRFGVRTCQLRRPPVTTLGVPRVTGAPSTPDPSTRRSSPLCRVAAASWTFRPATPSFVCRRVTSRCASVQGPCSCRRSRLRPGHDHPVQPNLPPHWTGHSHWENSLISGITSKTPSSARDHRRTRPDARGTGAPGEAFAGATGRSAWARRLAQSAIRKRRAACTPGNKAIALKRRKRDAARFLDPERRPLALLATGWTISPSTISPSTPTATDLDSCRNVRSRTSPSTLPVTTPSC